MITKEKLSRRRNSPNQYHWKYTENSKESIHVNTGAVKTLYDVFLRRSILRDRELDKTFNKNLRKVTKSNVGRLLKAGLRYLVV